MISCLIIENNINCVNLIRTIGNEFPKIYFSEINENQEVVLNTILKTNPELIFINFDSKKINYLEFLFEINQFSENKPYFIALSNSKDKAFDSYKCDFSDFILKPLNELSVRKSILKYQKKHSCKPIETICLKSYKDYQYLNIDDILYLKADNNTTDFHMIDGRIVGAYKTLKVFENSLPQTFLRIHKSYIVNTNHISRIQYGKSICLIKNKYKIPFTKTFINNIDVINTNLSRDSLITLN